MRALVLVLSLALPLVACSSKEGDDAPVKDVWPRTTLREPTPDEEKAYWPERTTEALREELRAACAASTREDKALLLVFSAPWCGDCRDLWRAEQKPELEEPMRGFRKVVANIGRFDSHEELSEAFEVEYLPTLVIFHAPDCAKRVESWKVATKTSLEGLGREAAPAKRIAAWLEGARSP